MIPLIGEMSAKQTKGCPNSENFAPAVNSHRTPRREQAPAPPCKLYFVRVGAIHESPAVSAPSRRGLSNAQHLTGGEFSVSLSLRHALRRATSLPEGGTTGRRVAAPYARISVCPFRNSQQTPRREQNSPNSGTLRREQAPALPCKLYFVRVGNGLDRSANLPIYWGGGTRKARDGGAKSQQNLRAGVETRPYGWKDKPQFYLSRTTKKRTKRAASSVLHYNFATKSLNISVFANSTAPLSTKAAVLGSIGNRASTGTPSSFATSSNLLSPKIEWRLPQSGHSK